jgi:hypothetical protein
MNRSFFIVAVASTIAAGSALVACGSRVICEGTACGGGTGMGGASNVVPNSSASVGHVSSVGPSSGTGMGDAHSVILYGTDPLTLRFTSFPLSCSDPEQNAPFGQCGWYTLELTFPASLLQPGPFDMLNPSITVFEQSASMANGPTPGDCGGTGGVTGGGVNYLGGTITFVSIDAASLVVDLDGVTSFTTDGFDLNGMYTAPRCQ